MSLKPDEIKNIEIIVEGMNKVIEVITQQLDQFVYDPSTKTQRLREGKTVKNIYEDFVRASILYLTVSVPPSNLIRDLLEKLRWDKPEIAKYLEEKYHRHLRDESELSKIKDADNLYNELFSIQCNLRDLARTLQAGTKKADLARKKATETENIEQQKKDGQAEPLKEPAKAKPDSALAGNINIQNFQGILGDVQAENVQTGDYTSICKHDGIEKKKKGIIKKLFGIIAAVVAFLVALLGIFNHLGWLEPIKEFISRIFLHN